MKDSAVTTEVVEKADESSDSDAEAASENVQPTVKSVQEMTKQELHVYYAQEVEAEVNATSDQHKLTTANKGHQMLQKMGWTEGTPHTGRACS